MKTQSPLLKIVALFIFLLSCDYPETVLTNYVHPDGSVTREVVMRSDKKDIKPSTYRVPVDSTWTFSSSIELDGKDTLWVYTAVKDFPSTEEINQTYRADSGVNRSLSRSASFSRKFRWFTTMYEYTEQIDRMLDIEYLPETCMTPEQLNYFYMPESMLDSLKDGSDSLLYREIITELDSVQDRYLFKAMIEQWAHSYLQIQPDSAFILNRKDSLFNHLEDSDFETDSLYRMVFGEAYYEENKSGLDSAAAIVEQYFEALIYAEFYTCQTVLPHALLSTNGFVDASGKVSWPVDSKYFFAQDYVMQAVSKRVNVWAWVVSGVFVVFVVVGLGRRIIE